MMLKHPFGGDGQYCQAWLDSAPMGNPKTTGVITMRTQCGYPRDCHPSLDWKHFRILVTGSRHATFEHHASVIRAELMLAFGHIRASEMDAGRVILVHGDAPGADIISEEIMRKLPWPIAIELYPAKDFGTWPSCGPRRNTHMVSLGADICLAFPQPKSKGTWDCAKKAVDAGIPVVLRSLTVPS